MAEEVPGLRNSEIEPDRLARLDAAPPGKQIELGDDLIVLRLDAIHRLDGASGE